MTRWRLDRQIAAGSAYESSAALALRAVQLIDPRTRRAIARDLHGVLRYVDRVRPRPAFSAVVIDHRAVLGGRHAIVGLAERLEGKAPVAPRGVALVRTLLTDGASPLFNRNAQHTVTQAIWRIEDALGEAGGDPVSPD